MAIRTSGLLLTPAAQRLLDVADALFYDEGIHAVGIGKILAKAQVAKATMYQQFASKDDLVEAYLRQRMDVGQAAMDRAVSKGDGDAVDRIAQIFEHLSKWASSTGFRGCPFINAAAEYPDVRHPAHQVVLEHRERNRNRFHSLATELGSDPEVIVDALMFLYDGVLVGADLDTDASYVRRAPEVARALAVALSDGPTEL